VGTKEIEFSVVIVYRMHFIRRWFAVVKLSRPKSVYSDCANLAGAGFVECANTSDNRDKNLKNFLRA